MRADRDVGAQFARRPEERERENIGRDDGERAGVVRGLDERLVVEDRAVGRGILQEDAEDLVVESEGRVIADDDLDAERLRARLHDLDRLRVAAFARRKRSGARSTTAWQSAIASAAAVASSSSEALAMSSAVRSVTIVWKLSSASRRPCAISAW